MKKVYLIVFSCSLLLVGCKKNTVEDEYTINLKKWNSQQILNYEFNLGIDCYCLPERVGPHLVGVKNNILTTINNLPYDESKQGKIMTINELFAYIKETDAKKPFEKQVKYNDTYGYPEYIYYDFVQNIADEEIGFYVLSFQKK
jgi:hypothetical protein